MSRQKVTPIPTRDLRAEALGLTDKELKAMDRERREAEHVRQRAECFEEQRRENEYYRELTVYRKVEALMKGDSPLEVQPIYNPYGGMSFC